MKRLGSGDLRIAGFVSCHAVATVSPEILALNLATLSPATRDSVVGPANSSDGGVTNGRWFLLLHRG